MKTWKLLRLEEVNDIEYLSTIDRKYIIVSTYINSIGFCTRINPNNLNNVKYEQKRLSNPNFPLT